MDDFRQLFSLIQHLSPLMKVGFICFVIGGLGWAFSKYREKGWLSVMPPFIQTNARKTRDALNGRRRQLWSPYLWLVLQIIGVFFVFRGLIDEFKK